MRRLAILAAAPLAAILLAGSPIVHAQTEDVDKESSSRVVSPDECVVEPAAADAFAASLVDGAEVQGIKIAVPLGMPASSEQSVAIQDATRQIVACLNAGDFLREASLTTANGAKVLLGGLAAGGAEDLATRLAAAPVVRDEASYIRLLAITDPAVTDDGRVVAFVVLNEPVRPPRGPETLLFVFKDDAGTLKLDYLLGFTDIKAVMEQAAADAAAATPAAEGTPAS
ncbi:MAG: hypothetical protein ACR2J8_00235 [Thermomicrobiales bacterium]